MAEQSKITWTDATFNPWRGCTKVEGSRACDHCYAESMSERNPGTLGVWGDDGVRVVGAESYWRQPIKWNAAAEKAGQPMLVFCASLADVFEDWKGPMTATNGFKLINDGGPITMQDVRRRLFELIDQTPWLRWILVTKRPEHIHRFWPGVATYRKNVWLITTTEDQHWFDTRWPLLAQCRYLAPVLGISAEPLLGPIDLSTQLPLETDRDGSWRRRSKWCEDVLLDWCITGCESRGQGLGRPMELEWEMGLQNQCKALGTSFFRKQVGYYGKLSKNPSDWPESMRVQEFPGK